MSKNWRRGQSKNIGVTQNNTLSRRLMDEYHMLGTWKAVALKFKVSRAMAYRVAYGYEPRTAAIRFKFGLPCLVPAPACQKCGDVHVTKKCTATPRKPARRAYRYVEFPVFSLGDLADLAAAQPDARVVVLGVGAEFESVRVGWQR